MRYISGPNANALRMCQVIKLMIASDLLNSYVCFTNDNEAINYRINENDNFSSSDAFAQVPIPPVIFSTRKTPIKHTDKGTLFYIAGAIARYIYNLSKPLYIRKTKPIVLCSTCESLLNTKINNPIFEN